jgi:hypothetical protein
MSPGAVGLRSSDPNRQLGMAGEWHSYTEGSQNTESDIIEADTDLCMHPIRSARYHQEGNRPRHTVRLARARASSSC